MRHFRFYNPVKVLFGAGQIANLASQIPQGSKVMMTYGGGSIKKNGIYQQVVKALEKRDVPHEMMKWRGIGKKIAIASPSDSDNVRRGDRKITVELITNMDYWNQIPRLIVK